MYVTLARLSSKWYSSLDAGRATGLLLRIVADFGRGSARRVVRLFCQLVALAPQETTASRRQSDARRGITHQECQLPGSRCIEGCPCRSLRERAGRGGRSSLGALAIAAGGVKRRLGLGNRGPIWLGLHGLGRRLDGRLGGHPAGPGIRPTRFRGNPRRIWRLRAGLGGSGLLCALRSRRSRRLELNKRRNRRQRQEHAADLKERLARAGCDAWKRWG